MASSAVLAASENGFTFTAMSHIPPTISSFTHCLAAPIYSSLSWFTSVLIEEIAWDRVSKLCVENWFSRLVISPDPAIFPHAHLSVSGPFPLVSNVVMLSSITMWAILIARAENHIVWL